MIRNKHYLHYIALYVLAFVSLFPLLWAISNSFRTNQEIYKYAMPFTYKTIIPVEPTLTNYITLFRQFDFLQAIINTSAQIVILVFSGCLVNSVAAFAFVTFDFKFKNTIFAFFLVSFMIPFESTALPLYNLIRAFNWVDTLPALIFPGIANGLVLFLFRQFFQDIPVGFVEAARVDGASWRHIYLKIIFPLSLPVFITAGLMMFITYWNAYLWPLLVARSRSIFTIQIALSRLKMENETLWSYWYAGSVISALLPLLLFLPFQKYFVDGIISSGIKG